MVLADAVPYPASTMLAAAANANQRPWIRFLISSTSLDDSPTVAGASNRKYNMM